MVHSHDDILIISVSGVLTDVLDMSRQLLHRVKENKRNKVLLDMRTLEGRPSISETYFLAQKVGPSLDNTVTTAIVEKREHIDFAHFHRLALRNVGYRNLKYFFDYDHALEWLSSTA